MATSSTGHAGQITVTITAAAASSTATPGSDNNGDLDTTSSTLSLIYVYSTSTNSEPTDAASSSNSYNSSSSHHLSGGAIAGIVVGSVALLAILALALFCYSRHVARRRRAEIASLQPSRHPAPSRAYSHATTIQGGQMTGGGAGGASTNGRTTRNSHYARSMGERSMATTVGGGGGGARRSLKSPDLLPVLPPQELPTPHNRPELDGRAKQRSQKSSRSRTKPRGAAEVYGSMEHPVELQAGSMTDLVAVIQEMKRVKVPGTEGGSYNGNTHSNSGSSRGGRQQQDRDSDTLSARGYLSPAWPPHSGAVSSESGLVSDMDGTETDYDSGEGGMTGDAGSIHIYYRSSAATIAAAMSQASSMKGPRSTIRSSSTTARLV
ncbi:hypothetical protein M406DRAFT_333802 [Cryphonectria parasitica EP155]|uniref:Uncharacterized protein n=1 Tax=Cryphonectria parasitica (strain ATCC 38755 / EP155) TaxID=660469 RepID=A0A9P5CLE6_CRYP1|nr:uncharacterized protein M406DRAFT_333802 [Cryphonectria parasitica EP155]KAF3761750.1 hypothetical protein M406DRAFT_333802 [Cryphonectria parasitica EP155]